jgi:CheY-like chemotaxis protein
VEKTKGMEPIADLTSVLSRKVVGQPAVTQVIVPYIDMFQAGLAPEGRPAGVFLLLGPTGTGKTKTVEALAEALHGSEKNLVKIDCGEYQMEHEVVKLIGAPPGYSGHRETPAVITQQKLTDVASERCGLSLVLFDEIEKAAPTVTRLLLGLLDKATLRLGDGSSVNFENALVFLTSNLGAREMMREIKPGFGFESTKTAGQPDLPDKLQNIALGAVRKRFSPEFINRIDCIITYQPLTAESLSSILDSHIADLQNHVNTRLGDQSFALEVTPEARRILLQQGASSEYGVRELKRTIHRQLAQPLAALVARNQIAAGGHVLAEPAANGSGLIVRPLEHKAPEPPVQVKVLLVDDNPDLLQFLGRAMTDAGWQLHTAGSAAEARLLLAENSPDAILIDYLLPDGNAVELGHEFVRTIPGLSVAVMASTSLSPEEEAICQGDNFLLLRKPFLAVAAVNQIRERLGIGVAASGTAH